MDERVKLCQAAINSLTLVLCLLIVALSIVAINSSDQPKERISDPKQTKRYRRVIKSDSQDMVINGEATDVQGKAVHIRGGNVTLYGNPASLNIGGGAIVTVIKGE